MIPRHPGQNHAHATGIGDPSKHEASADECRETDEVRMNRQREDRAEQHEETSSDADLTFERDRLLPADDRQSGRFPASVASVAVNEV